MKKLSLKETHAPYIITLDDETLLQETMLVNQDGAPLGMLIPMKEYAEYQGWRATRSGEHPTHITQPPIEHDRQVFDRIRPELLQQYQGRVVAIYQGKVVQVSDEGETLADFAVRIYKRIGYLPIYFQAVEERPSVLKFPYFKVVR